MCVLLDRGSNQLTRRTGHEGEEEKEEQHTSSREISSRMSITSRAAWRLDADSTLGILLGGESWVPHAKPTSYSYVEMSCIRK